MSRRLGRWSGALSLGLGAVILGRGILEHARPLYDLMGLLFLGLGAARLRELRRRER